MPIYDYQCRACGHRFETLVRGGSTPACPQCAATELDKQVSQPVPPGLSKAIIASNRKVAALAGHMSNYSKAERAKLLK